MNPIYEFCAWLYATAPATALRESDVVFPAVETLHVLSLTLMVGTVAIVDLRLLGRAFRSESVTSITQRLLPLTWIGFALMVVTGLSLFASEAEKLYSNPAFRAKVVLLAFAGLNPLILHTLVFRNIGEWDRAPRPPASVRLAAMISLLSWAAVIAAGRLIAYFA